MTTDLVAWRPAVLPDGWRVVNVSATIDERYVSYDVELAHHAGWVYRFVTLDPTQIDETGLAAFLNALTTARLGGVVDVWVTWDARRRW